MEKRNAAITVRFTDAEKDSVLTALSIYGDPAVAARMILQGFAAGHHEYKRMMWPPESRPADNALTPELLKAVEQTLIDRGQLLASDQDDEPYKVRKKNKK